MYALAGLVGMKGGGGVDFDGDAWQGLKDGIGLVHVFGAMAGKGLVDIAANLDSLQEVCWVRTVLGQRNPSGPCPRTPSEWTAQRSIPSPSTGTFPAQSGLSSSAGRFLARL